METVNSDRVSPSLCPSLSLCPCLSPSLALFLIVFAFSLFEVVPTLSIALQQLLSLSHDDLVAATGEFLAAHIDMATRRTADFAPQVAANLDRMLAEHAALDWQPSLSGAIQVR